MLNSLSFCLSVKLFISPSYLNEILAGYSNLGCRFSFFFTLTMFCHSLLAWKVSFERSAIILMGIPLCVICCLSLAAFNSCSLCLIFVSLINMFLGVFHLGFILFGTLSFLDLGRYFLPHFRKLFNYYLLKYFLMAFLSSSVIPLIWLLGRLTLSQRSLKLSSFPLILSSSLLHLFPPFYLPLHLSYLLSQLFCWFPSEYFWSQYWLTILFLLGPC